MNLATQIVASLSVAQTVLGGAFDCENYVQNMMALGKQKQREEAERKEKAKRERPQTQAQMATYMRNVVYNQSTTICSSGLTKKQVQA